jgi:hypothetical protein
MAGWHSRWSERVIGYFDEIELRGEVEQRVERRYHRALECLAVANPREPAKAYLAGCARRWRHRRA